jgi:HAD superfamily hydrolase (TIGR01450 family)
MKPFRKVKASRVMKHSRNGWNEPLGPVEGFMFDLDGTLVLTDRSLSGYHVLPGAVEMLTELKSRGIPFVALTNGSAHPVAEQAPKLRAVGLPIEDDALLTPNSVAADLMPRRGVKRTLVLGSPGVARSLADVGIDSVFPGQEGAENVQAVYIAWHPDCNMKDIEAAIHAIWNGAQLYVASDVPFFATKHGKTMGYSHAITAAVLKMTGAPMILTGKPSLHALRLVAKRLAVPMRRVGVIGDDPLVEMIMARRGGAMGFGVTTGIMTAEGWAAQPRNRRPHRIVRELAEILDLTGRSTQRLPSSRI